MKEKGAEVHLLASLYDIAWLLNVRGNDISYVPVVLSYLALTQEQCIWFLQEEVVDDTRGNICRRMELPRVRMRHFMSM